GQPLAQVIASPVGSPRAGQCRGGTATRQTAPRHRPAGTSPPLSSVGAGGRRRRRSTQARGPPGSGRCPAASPASTPADPTWRANTVVTSRGQQRRTHHLVWSPEPLELAESGNHG